MDAVRRKMSPRRVDAALQQVLRDFARVTLEREMRITEIIREPNRLAFVWEGRQYVVLIAPSTTPPAALPTQVGEATLVYLANLSAYTPAPGELWLDAANLTAIVTDDPVYAALRVFLQRYYGMRFAL
jgi:hypothetical protein